MYRWVKYKVAESLLTVVVQRGAGHQCLSKKKKIIIIKVSAQSERYHRSSQCAKNNKTKNHPPLLLTKGL